MLEELKFAMGWNEDDVTTFREKSAALVRLVTEDHEEAWESGDSQVRSRQEIIHCTDSRTQHKHTKSTLDGSLPISDNGKAPRWRVECPPPPTFAPSLNIYHVALPVAILPSYTIN